MITSNRNEPFYSPSLSAREIDTERPLYLKSMFCGLKCTAR